MLLNNIKYLDRKPGLKIATGEFVTGTGYAVFIVLSIGGRYEVANKKISGGTNNRYRGNASFVTLSSLMNEIRKDIQKLANPHNAEILQRFFKTGPGQYGEGDVFLGIKIPPCRAIAKKHYKSLKLSEVLPLLKSKYHEERMIALIMLVLKFAQAAKAEDEKAQKQIYQFYLKHLKWVNNWDLVDGSCRYILGEYLLHRDRKILYKLARSKNLWQRRVAMITTYYFITQKDYKDTLKLAEILLQDPHDLMHKAVGWMLREVGNRDPATEKKFLNKYAAQMPRTMLRYAIEKFPAAERARYLKS